MASGEIALWAARSASRMSSGDVILTSSGDNARRLGTKPTNRRKRKESETDESQQMWNFAVPCGAQSVAVEVLPGP